MEPSKTGTDNRLWIYIQKLKNKGKGGAENEEKRRR